MPRISASATLVSASAKLLFAALILLAVLSQSWSFNQKLYLGDEGVATMDAWRISQGQVPVRDFFEIVPPFSFLPTAALYALLGPSVAATRILAFLYGLLLIYLTERMVSRFTGNNLARALPVAVLAPAGVAFWPIPSHHWVVDLLQLGALLLLVAGLRGMSPAISGTLAGVLTALGCLTLQDQGTYMIVALLLFFFPWIEEKRMRRNMFLFWIGGGFLVAALSLGFLFIEHVPLRSVAYQWAVFPAMRYQNINSNPMGIFAGWEEIAGLWRAGRFWGHPVYMLALTLAEAFIWISPVAAILLSLLSFRKKWFPRSEAGLLMAGLVAFLGGCAHRWTLTNIQWALPLPLIIVAIAISRGLKADKPLTRGLVVFLWAGYVIPSAIFALAYMSLSSPSQTTAVRSPAGTLRTLSRQEAEAAQGAIDAICENVPPKAPLFIDGYMPLISFLTLHPNPTPFTFFYYPHYNTYVQAKEVRQILEALPVSYVLAAKPLRKDSFMHLDYMEHYEALWQNDRAILFVRNQGNKTTFKIGPKLASRSKSSLYGLQTASGSEEEQMVARLIERH